MSLSVLFALAAQTAAQQPLNLTCFGEGTANKLRSATVSSNSYGSGMIGGTPVSGGGHTSSTVDIPYHQDFADQVDLRLFSGDDRVRLPRTMLPIFKGGDGGWFKLKNVNADARSIQAKAAVNFINSPNIFVDRVTGTISISGKGGNYTGQCQVIAADAAAKF